MQKTEKTIVHSPQHRGQLGSSSTMFLAYQVYIPIYILYIYNTKLKSVQIEYNHIGILSVPKLPIFGGLNYSNYSPPKIVGYHCIMLNQYSSIDVFLFFVYLINYCYNAVPFLASKVGL